jgi:hypothetical protein
MHHLFQELKKHRIVFTFCLLYLLFLLYVNSNSPEIFWADDLYHLEESFLLSRGDIRYAVDGWTKPMFAFPCAVMIRLLGYTMTSCRLINIISICGILLILYFLILYFTDSKIFSLFGAISLAIIPIVIQTTISTLSQIEFAFVLLLGVYMAIKKRFYLSSLLFGLLPLIRSEGLVLVILWVIYYYLTNSKERHSRRIILVFISTVPSIMWSIGSYFVTGRIFPEVIYPFYSPYPEVHAFEYSKNIIINFGIINFIIFIFSLLGFLRYDWHLKFVSLIVLIISGLHLVLAHFSLGGSIGAVEYLVPFFPLLILLEVKSLHFLIGKSKKRFLCFLPLIAQFILFYTSGFYPKVMSRPYNYDTLLLFDLSKYFYQEILPRNESVQFCGAQVIRNFDDSDLDVPIQIRFQHNPSDEMPDICPTCFYSSEFTGADWVIWNEGWCRMKVGNEFVSLPPENLINESYQVVKKFDSSKIVFKLIH